MEPLYPGTSGLLRDWEQQTILAAVRHGSQFSLTEDSIADQMPMWLERFRTNFQDRDSVVRLWGEIRRWVYWTRLPGLWLASIYAELCREHSSEVGLNATLLLALAQENCGNDARTQSALEQAYYDCHLDDDNDNNVHGVRAHLVERLKQFHSCYGEWINSPGIDYSKWVNSPGTEGTALFEHSYQARTWSTLGTVFPALRSESEESKVVQLRRVVQSCLKPGFDYFLPLSLRLLATELLGEGDLAAARRELERARDEAERTHHDAELGHILRLLAWVLKLLGEQDLAVSTCRQVLSHEGGSPFLSYWRALTAKLLGLIISTPFRIGLGFNADGKAGLQAFRVAREALDTAMQMTELPIVRVARAQLLRNYSWHAIRLAQLLGRTDEIVAQIESSGPHLLPDAFAEITALGLVFPREELQLSRATFHRHLTSVPESFDEYLEAIPAEWPARAQYLGMRSRSDVAVNTAQALSSTFSVDRLNELRVKDTALVFVHLEETQGMLVFWRLEERAPAR